MRAMTEPNDEIDTDDESPPRRLWIRNVLFLSLGLLGLFLGSFLLMGKMGPEAFFVLLLWSLPLFLH